VIAFVPPANTGTGRDMDALFVISPASCFQAPFTTSVFHE
jgi:hypothetical protein